MRWGALALVLIMGEIVHNSLFLIEMTITIITDFALLTAQHITYPWMLLEQIRACKCRVQRCPTEEPLVCMLGVRGLRLDGEKLWAPICTNTVTR